jgi:hypothetical protein
METEDMLPTTLKAAPVTVAWEMFTAAVPVLVKVKDCVLLDPAETFPKFMLVALAASVPDGVELDFAADVPALVKPVQPAIDSTAKHPRISGNMPQRPLRFGVKCQCKRRAK